jgi:hypothetical protein
VNSNFYTDNENVIEADFKSEAAISRERQWFPFA